MDKLNDYFIELQTLNVKSDKVLSIKEYNQFESNYNNKLKTLQKLAINECRFENSGEVERHLVVFKELQNTFNEFGKYYLELIKDQTINVFDLEHNLNKYFIVPKFNTVLLENDFLLDLVEAYSLKDGSLNSFISQLESNTRNIRNEFRETDNREVTPKRKKDTRFWLTSFFEKLEQDKHEYKSIQEQIKNNGWFIVKTENETVKIYTPELAVIFTSKELPARNMETQKETTLNGWEYFKTYIEAYKEGEQYFENEIKVSSNTLYGANAEQYVKDIHLNFFHVLHTGAIEGWGYVKKQYPIILTHKAVKEYGYYSGIVNKVEEQVKKHPRLFETFDKCEHNLPPQQAKKKTDNDLPKQLIVFKEPETVNEFHNILKGYFNPRETDLLKALKGEQLETALLFPHNQNKFVEVFRRAKYNGLLTSSPTEIKNWLCVNFEFRYKHGALQEIRKFNTSTVHDMLTKGTSEPSKKERICFEGVEWLPYKSKKQLDNEAQKEQL